MRKALPAIITLFILILTSCVNSELPSGEPFDVLSEAKYNQLLSMCDDLGKFQDGYAIIHKLDGGYGIISYKGKIILPCEYDAIMPYNKDTRVIKKDEKYGLCSISGKIITECQYTDFNNGWAIDEEELIPFALNNKWGLVSTKDGKQQFIFKYDAIEGKHGNLIIAAMNGKKGVIDQRGNQVIDFIYPEMYFASKGYIKVKKDELYGVLDSLGNVKLDCRYETILDFGNVKWAENKGKWGYLSEDYSPITECIYDSYGFNYDGVITLSLNNRKRYGAIDAKDGKTIIPFDYLHLGSYSEGLFAAEKKFNGEDKYGYIDTTNTAVIPFIYQNADDFSEGLACVHKKGKTVYSVFGPITSQVCGFINKKGETVIPFKFQWQFGAVRFSEGLAAIGKDNDRIWALGNYGYINTSGDLIIQYQFDEANDFENGVARVKENGKYGYINTFGEYVIPCEYEDYEYSSDGICLIKNGISYCFDYNGNRK